MASKTISVREEAYAALVRARRRTRESFSEVILRATWQEEAPTGARLLAWIGSSDRWHLPTAVLDAVEDVKGSDTPSTDKWADEPDSECP